MIDLLRARRSIRVYETRKVEPEKIEFFKEGILRSPSSRNINPWEWEFIFIDNRELLKNYQKLKNTALNF